LTCVRKRLIQRLELLTHTRSTQSCGRRVAGDTNTQHVHTWGKYVDSGSEIRERSFLVCGVDRTNRDSCGSRCRRRIEGVNLKLALAGTSDTSWVVHTFSLPAATTATTPALVRAAIAALSADDLEPPNDMFITAFPANPRAVALVATESSKYRISWRNTKLTKIDARNHTGCCSSSIAIQCLHSYQTGRFG
jgi:hypothetical protein